MHLDDERIQRLIHGELTPDISVREHIAVCSDCQARLADARVEEQEINALLQTQDHRPPQLDATMLVQKARARPGWGRWAAGILLAASVAGAAYAVERIIESERSPAPPDSIARPAPTVAVERRGISVAPGNSLVILLAAPQTQGQLHVVMHDSAEVAVEASGGNASFTSDVGRLLIDNAGSSADYQIRIPRASPHVEIRVGDRRIFLKEGASIVSDVPADARGAYLLSLGAR